MLSYYSAKRYQAKNRLEIMLKNGNYSPAAASTANNPQIDTDGPRLGKKANNIWGNPGTSVDLGQLLNSYNR